MPNYRRNFVPGGTYFFTVVTHERRPWLCTDQARRALREAIELVRTDRPFRIEAWVLLPDHLHCIWTLPPGDADFPGRWRRIKAAVSKRCAEQVSGMSADLSRAKRGERLLWQRRFWEHTVRNERDLAAHADYIHYNPVKHGFCVRPAEWPYSSFHRFVRMGFYGPDWACAVPPAIPDDVGRE